MIDIKITGIERDYNDMLHDEEWRVTFEFDLKGDHYMGTYDYCAGNEYEMVRDLEVTLEGVPQYGSPQWDNEKREWLPFADTYLARTVGEDYWHDEFIYGVLNPIWEARDTATIVASRALIGTVVKAQTDEEI